MRSKCINLSSERCLRSRTGADSTLVCRKRLISKFKVQKMPREHTSNHFGYSLEETDTHHHSAKRYAKVGWKLGPPARLAQFDVTEWRQNVRQRTSASSSDEFKYGPQVTGNQS